MTEAARKRSRGEDTRAAILSEAEALFAERGYAETRLEDVADRIGVKRAALFYHFKDKRTLYECVLEDVFGSLLEQARVIFASTRDLQLAMEQALGLWVDTVWSRPTLAQLLLREATNRGEQAGCIRRLAGPALDMLRRCVQRGEREGHFHPLCDDLLHLVSMMAGPTVFYVAALPGLLPGSEFDPHSEERRDTHRRDVIRATRRILGMRPPWRTHA